MLQQLDDTWNPHLPSEFFRVCLRFTPSQLGQITSSQKAQELIQLETTLTNLYNYKKQLILNKPTTTQHTKHKIGCGKARLFTFSSVGCK